VASPVSGEPVQGRTGLLRLCSRQARSEAGVGTEDTRRTGPVSAVRISAGASIRKIRNLLAAGPDPPANEGHHLGCGLPEKLAAKIKSAETMENAWIRLEAWFGDKSLFIKDLMQDIRSVTPIKDSDDERLMDYYVMLQAHITEARNADALDMLLIPANVELMVLPLTTWEKRIWREAQGRLPAEERSWYMDVFVNKRLLYAINMVATSERHVLPKATPLHRSQRSPSSEGRGGQYSRPRSSGRNARVMTVTESRSADRKKVRFPPPKA
jgi:hypothetical protein